MSKNIVFFNKYHNGDIHVSRGIVYHIIKKLLSMDSNFNFYYYHNNFYGLLADIPNLHFNDKIGDDIKDNFCNLEKIKNNLFINTWYGQQNLKYMLNYGISFDTIYSALDDTCKKEWQFSLSDISKDPSIFLPFIDYNKFYINEAKKWIDNHNDKKIFISNGTALSGQSYNFDMDPFITKIAEKHKDKIFILSNINNKINLPNVFYSKDIINKNGNDLNENAFISEYCDAIIGRASGPLTFAMTQNNLLKRKCKILCFTNLTSKYNKFWLSDLMHDKINYSAEITINDSKDDNSILELMENQLY